MDHHRRQISGGWWHDAGRSSISSDDRSSLRGARRPAGTWAAGIVAALALVIALFEFGAVVDEIVSDSDGMRHSDAP
jgi:hypothetical protein